MWWRMHFRDGPTRLLRPGMTFPFMEVPRPARRSRRWKKKERELAKMLHVCTKKRNFPLGEEKNPSISALWGGIEKVSKLNPLASPFFPCCPMPDDIPVPPFSQGIQTSLWRGLPCRQEEAFEQITITGESPRVCTPALNNAIGSGEGGNEAGERHIKIC